MYSPWYNCSGWNTKLLIYLLEMDICMHTVILYILWQRSLCPIKGITWPEEGGKKRNPCFVTPFIFPFSADQFSQRTVRQAKRNDQQHYFTWPGNGPISGPGFSVCEAAAALPSSAERVLRGDGEPRGPVIGSAPHTGQNAVCHAGRLHTAGLEGRVGPCCSKVLLDSLHDAAVLSSWGLDGSM